MKKLQINPKELLKSIGILCLYFLLQFILTIVFLLLNQLKILPYSLTLFNFLMYICLSIIISLIYRKTLIKDFKTFTKDYKKILNTSFNWWLKGLFISYLGNIIIVFVHLPEITNQNEVINLLKDNFIITSIMTVILAPITEELFFRRGFKKFTNNKHLYAITSGLIFGGMHLLSSINSLSDLPMLLYLIPYSSLGIAFAYSYNETDNIFGTICLHALHNALSIILVSITLGGVL